MPEGLVGKSTRLVCLWGVDPMPFASPRELGIALRRGSGEGRRVLALLCRTPLLRLVQWAEQQYPIAEPTEWLLECASRWVEMFVASRDPRELAQFAPDLRGWLRFRAYLLTKVARLLLYEPASAQTADRPAELDADLADLTQRPKPAAPEGMTLLGPPGSQYRVWWYWRPYKEVSGDLIEFSADGGDLWVLVADASGRPWPAHLAIQGVAELWRFHLRQTGSDPRTLLDALQRKLEEYLPEGIFVEAVAARFARCCVTVASAGRGWLLIRQADNHALWQRLLSGQLLGVCYPESDPRDQETWPFRGGDELTLATDGFYEQPAGEGPVGDIVLDRMGQAPAAAPLHDALRELLGTVLHQHPQRDDITLATVQGC